MPRVINVKVLAPGFGPTETLAKQVDLLLDFAQFCDFPEFQLLAQTLNTIEKEFGNGVCIELPNEVQQFLLDTQGDIIAYTHNRINEDVQFANRAFALAKKIGDNPEQAHSMDKAIAAERVGEIFEEMFLEEIEDWFWYPRLVALFIWRWDNWLGDKVAVIYSSFMADMINEVSYWKMARQVSVARAIGGIHCHLQQKKAAPGPLFHTLKIYNATP